MLQRARNSKQVLPADWFYPNELIEQLESLEQTLPWIWPNEADYSLVLTHDVETSDGIKRIPEIAKIEEDLGFRSAWYLVPYKYKIDRGLVQELRDRGHEIGIHGYNHDGRLFCSEATFRKRLKYINEAIRDYEAVGFRTPMVHRNLNWMQGLDVDYDASVFDVDPLQAMPGGVQTVWPFIVRQVCRTSLHASARSHDSGHTWRENRSHLARKVGVDPQRSRDGVDGDAP